MKNVVNIIIIGYGPKLKRLDKACISSILFNTKHPYVITYFDNYESGSSLTKIWNTFIKAHDTQFVCLLNNDTIVSAHWLSKLVSVFEKDEKIGFVGPSGKCHSPQNQIKSLEEAKKYKDKIEIFDEDHKHLSGFCLLFRKSIWDKLGLNENYPLYGSESEFMQRARETLGYKFAWRKDVYIEHLGESSTKMYKIDTELERDKAKELYWTSKKRGKKYEYT
jgi:GT2 family glycosyltransferase